MITIWWILEGKRYRPIDIIIHYVNSLSDIIEVVWIVWSGTIQNAWIVLLLYADKKLCEEFYWLISWHSYNRPTDFVNRYIYWLYSTGTWVVRLLLTLLSYLCSSCLIKYWHKSCRPTVMATTAWFIVRCSYDRSGNKNE